MSKSKKMRLEMIKKKLETNNDADTSSNPNDNLFKRYTYASGFKNVDIIQKSLITVINFELCCERMALTPHNTLDIDYFYDALAGTNTSMIVGSSKKGIPKSYRQKFETTTIPLLKHLKRYFLETKNLYDIISNQHSAMFVLSNAIKYRIFNSNHTVFNGTSLTEKHDINSLITMLKNVIASYKKYGNGYYKNLIAHLC